MSGVVASELGDSFGLVPADFATATDRFVHALLGVHEIGHAIAAEHCGYEVTGTEVFPTETGHSGRTYVNASRMRADDGVVFALAGPAAEWLWLRQQFANGLDEATFRELNRHAICPHDRALLDQGLPKSSFRTMQDVFAAACRVVERHSEAVRDRADVLRTRCACLTRTRVPST